MSKLLFRNQYDINHNLAKILEFKKQINSSKKRENLNNFIRNKSYDKKLNQSIESKKLNNSNDFTTKGGMSRNKENINFLNKSNSNVNHLANQSISFMNSYNLNRSIVINNSENNKQDEINYNNRSSQSKVEKSLEHKSLVVKDFLKSIGIEFADKINFAKKSITEFKDGLLLNKVMSLVDSKYIHKVKIDPNPLYSSIAQANINKIFKYLKLKNVIIF